jgi:hypothetical protein
VTGDSDLFAYGATRLIIVRSWDSDPFAYGATRLIIICSWVDETFRSFNFNKSAMNDSQNTLMNNRGKSIEAVFK